MSDLSDTGGVSSHDVVAPTKSAIAEEDTWDDTESEASEAHGRKVRRQFVDVRLPCSTICYVFLYTVLDALKQLLSATLLRNVLIL